MIAQTVAMALIVVASFCYLTFTLMPTAWKGMLAARLSKRGRRPGTSRWLRTITDAAARRLARGAGCAGCASGGPGGGERLREMLREASQRRA